MITLFGILLATGSMLQPTIDLQNTLDNSNGIYIIDKSYIASHNYRRLGQKIAKMQVGQKFKFQGKDCMVKSKEIINYREKRMDDLTGSDLYLQTCIDEPDLGYLVESDCK